MTNSYRAVTQHVSLGVFLAALVSPSHAGLQWDRDTVEVACQPLQATVLAVFAVKNTGKTDIRVVKIRSSCSCTSVVCNKELLRPGESAEVDATINVGSLVKDVRRQLIVETEEVGRKQLTDLWIQIRSVPLAVIDPERLLWRQGELGTREVSIRLQNGATKSVLAHGAVGQPVDLQSGPGPGQYVLTVFPPVNGQCTDIRLTTDVRTPEGVSKIVVVPQSLADPSLRP